MSNLDNAIEGREVRLFSAVSITTDKEAEMRATSAFLSMVKAVSEFGRKITKIAGAPAGAIECFTEVELKDNTRNKSRPDGVIRITRGKTTWIALVEVKVGSNGLEQEQFDRYHNLAREHGFNALITISNQPAHPNGYPPVKVDQRKVKGTPVIHLSWARLLSEAQQLSWQSGVADEDQGYMLSEWIRYVNDPNARIVLAPSVGNYWNGLLSAAASEKLGSVKQDVESFIDTWIGFLSVQSFRLRASLGEPNVDLRLRGDEKKKPELYSKRLCTELMQTNKVQSNLVIPHTAGDLELTIDLRSRHVFFQVDVAAPSDKTTKGQVGWMISQLKKLDAVSSHLKLIVDWKKNGLFSETTISKAIEDRDSLLFDMENNPIPKEVEIRRFIIEWSIEIPKKKSDIFLAIGRNLEQFYQDVIQNLTVYTPSAPKMTKNLERNDAKDQMTSTAERQPIYIPPWCL